MPVRLDGSGCFPGQTAIKSVTQADLKRITYATTSGTGVPGRVMSVEDKWDNFSDIHGIGKKDTKFMKYQKSQAPLLDRTACSNRRDFVEMPLGDYQINTELAQGFRGNVDSGSKSMPILVSNNSHYREEFGNTSPERMRAAKRTSCKAKNPRTKTLSSMDDLMETRPRSHIHFGVPQTELIGAAEIVLARPNLGLSGTWGGGPPKSTYRAGFCGLRHNASAPEIEQVKRPMGLAHLGDPLQNMKRTAFLSPGM